MGYRPESTMVPKRMIQFKNCKVVIWADDYLETVFSDGKACQALFDYSEDQRRLAAELGYGADVRQMHLDHELAHTFLAEREGLPWSRVLRGVAAPDERMTDAERAAEEHRVLQFQMRLNGMDPDLVYFKARVRCR